MKIRQLLTLVITIFSFSCGEGEVRIEEDQDNDTIVVIHKDEPAQRDSVPVSTEKPVDKTPEKPVEVPPEKPVETSKSHSNEIFRDVKVSTVGSDKFRATGQARVFEASFSYVVEDGHFQLTKGHEMTDAGAPEWGNFDFTFGFDKAPGVSTTPHLILFVYSAKDGSIQNELPIRLPGY